MALLSFVESAPRAYRLKASNAASPISTSSGTIPAQVELREDADVDEEQLANRLVSHALGILHKKREATAQSPSTQSAPSRLIEAAKNIGITIAELARRTRLDEDVIVKLDLCRVKNVPRLCIVWLRTAIGSADVLMGLMVTGPPILAKGNSYKSTQRPEPKTEDFVESIRHSSLSDDDKQFWYDVAIADRSTGGPR
jgi:hypothetical protein